MCVTRIGSTAFVHLDGEADIWGWGRLRSMADAILQDPPAHVVFDMRRLRIARIRSLRLIAEICDRWESAGIRTTVSGVLPSVARAAALAEVRLPDAPGSSLWGKWCRLMRSRSLARVGCSGKPFEPAAMSGGWAV